MTFPVFASGDVLNASDMNAVGMWLLQPETAFSAVTTVTKDSIFTSSYTNYRIIVRYTTSTTNAASMQLRAAGVTASGSNYNQALLFNSTTTPTASTDNSATSWNSIFVSSSTFNACNVIELYAPQLATPTLGDVMSIVNLGAYTTNRTYKYALNHTLATAYDGFILSVATGTFSGTYSVYGYTKG